MSVHIHIYRVSWQLCLCSGVQKYHSLWSLTLLVVVAAAHSCRGRDFVSEFFCQGEAIMFTRTTTAVAKLSLSLFCSLLASPFLCIHTYVYVHCKYVCLYVNTYACVCRGRQHVNGFVCSAFCT